MNTSRSAQIQLNNELRITKFDPDNITYLIPLVNSADNVSLWQLLPSIKEEDYRLFLENCITQQKPFTFETFLSEYSVWLRWVIYPCEKGVACLITDITANKKLEMERQKVIDDLLQRNRDLEQFSYIVSHNIRSPLATLLGFSNLLKADLNEREKAFIFKGLEKSAQKLDNTIRDVNEILNVKKEISQSKQNVNLNELIQSVLGSIEGLIKSSDAQIEYDFSEIKEIKSVKPYIHSIFLNLISNAIKYARRNVEPVIEIKSSKQGNYLVLKFKDNGTGIDLAKYGDQLFGLYKKFNFDVEGKGMGLFMVKTQVNAMGGSIEVESTLNEGTTFIVKLPL